MALALLFPADFWVRGKLYAYPLPTEWTWFRAEHDDKIYREKRAKDTFQAGLQYLPFLLDRAAPDTSLISYLSEIAKRKTGVLDAVRAKELPRLAWAEDKARAEEAVEVVEEVEEITITRPRVGMARR